MAEKTTREVCRGLEFGTLLNVQFEGIGSAKTAIIGLERERFLILKPPALAGLEGGLFQKNKTTITYLHEGMIYGFRCTLIGLVKTPFPLLILSYPEASEELNLRKHKRISCHLKGLITVNLVDYPILVQDLSLSGCRLIIPEAADVDMSKLHLGTEVALQIHLKGERTGALGIAALVKNLQRGRGGLTVGVEWGGEAGRCDPTARERLKGYIDAVQEAVLP